MLENWPKGVVCTSGRLLTTLTKLLHIHYVIKYTVAGCLISINERGNKDGIEFGIGFFSTKSARRLMPCLHNVRKNRIWIMNSFTTEESPASGKSAEMDFVVHSGALQSVSLSGLFLKFSPGPLFCLQRFGSVLNPNNNQWKKKNPIVC